MRLERVGFSVNIRRTCPAACSRERVYLDPDRLPVPQSSPVSTVPSQISIFEYPSAVVLVFFYTRVSVWRVGGRRTIPITVGGTLK